MFKVHSLTTPHQPSTIGQYLSIYHRLSHLNGIFVQPLVGGGKTSYWSGARIDVQAIPDENFGISYPGSESVPIEIVFDYPATISLDTLEPRMLGTVVTLIIDDIKQFVSINLPKQTACLCRLWSGVDQKWSQVNKCGHSAYTSAVLGGRMYSPIHLDGVFIVGSLASEARQDL